MKITIKDIVLVGLFTTLLFPVVLVGILLATGTVHLDLGVDDPTAKTLSEYLERVNPDQESADSKQSIEYVANQKLQNEISTNKEDVSAEIERLESLKIENSELKKELDSRKNEIEKLVNTNNNLSDERLENLAQVYGSMKPIEAAPILLSMDDVKITAIIKKVPEVRAQAKILAAVGAMDRERAANISKLLGWKKGS
jgi:flagellar motility protein MotE (MotC chaperone)